MSAANKPLVPARERPGALTPVVSRPPVALDLHWHPTKKGVEVKTDRGTFSIK